MALVGLASACPATVFGAPVQHRARHAQPLVGVTPLDASRATIVKRRSIRIRVRALRSMRLRVYALALPVGGGPGVVITRTRTVAVRSRRTRVIALPLIAAAKAALARPCPGAIEGRAVRLVGPRRRPSHTYAGRRRLAGPRGRCRGIGVGSANGASGTADLGGAFSPAQGGINDPRYNPDQGLGKCDPIDPSVCLLPFPNDYFTVSDATTVTGRRVSLDLGSMPANRVGKPIDPADINRDDGFSPDAPIVVRVPGLDTPQAFANTGSVPLTNVGASYDNRQPVVVINTRTLERQLIWTEIDSNPAAPANRTFTIHPAVNLPENTRFIVAMRNLRDASGATIPASAGFRTYRDNTPSGDPAVEARRKHFEALFNTLAAAGIDRDSLYLAWDFTTASERSLSERQLAIRNDAFKQLGDTNLADLRVEGSAPAFTVTKTTDWTPAQNANLARTVEGTFTVPCYLDLPGCPSGSRFLYPPGSTHGPPMAIPGNTETAYFKCNIPRIAMAQGGARPSLYGHGLFGSRDEVDQGQAQAMDQEHDFMYCATDWVGMACTNLPNSPPTPPAPSSPGDIPGEAASFFAQLVAAGTDPTTRNTPDCDIPTALSDEADLSNFPQLVDRVDQSFVNFMYLGRLMIHPSGFGANPAFQNAAGTSVIDNRRLFYDGNSQGGIFGGSLIALEPDLDRGVIGVTGESYATLLQRSSDFGTGAAPDPSHPGLPQYAYPLYQAYPNELERQLILSLMQQMWDHSDPAGLAAHMTTNPLPDTPAHHVLMQIALGDHQVSNYAALVEARTIGAHARVPWADPGRFYERDPIYAIPAITSYPFDGSAIAIFDSGPIRPATAGCEANNGVCGTDPDPIPNTPPTKGQDPHEAPRNTVQGRAMKSEFLRIGGQVVNTCGSRPCYSFGWNGP